MKAVFIFFAFLVTIGLHAGQDTGARFALPDDVANALDEAYVAENNGISGKQGTRKILMDYMKGHWREVIDNLHDIAPTKAKRQVLFRAAEFLSSNEFLLYLERIVELRKNDMIDNDEFLNCMSFYHYKSQFLSINIKHPRVQKIYIMHNEACRQLFPSLESFTVERIPEIKRRGIESRKMDGSGSSWGLRLRCVWLHGKLGLSGDQWYAISAGSLTAMIFMALAKIRRKIIQSSSIA